MSRWMLATLNLDDVVLNDVDHGEPWWRSSSNWEPQADALYHLGDFEHALVFYHRGLRYQVQSNTYVCSFTAPAVSLVILKVNTKMTKNPSISVILAVAHYPSLYGFPVCADYFRIFAFLQIFHARPRNIPTWHQEGREGYHQCCWTKSATCNYIKIENFCPPRWWPTSTQCLRWWKQFLRGFSPSLPMLLGSLVSCQFLVKIIMWTHVESPGREIAHLSLP